jgi:hypothetical protein
MSTMSTVDVAKAVRADVKTALKAGTLGDLPAGLTVSITSGDGLALTIKGAPYDWAWTGPMGTQDQKPSDAARALAIRLAAVARPHQAKGYGFGFVFLDSPGGAQTVLESLARPGWAPGQD